MSRFDRGDVVRITHLPDFGPLVVIDGEVSSKDRLDLLANSLVRCVFSPYGDLWDWIKFKGGTSGYTRRCGRTSWGFSREELSPIPPEVLKLDVGEETYFAQDVVECFIRKHVLALDCQMEEILKERAESEQGSKERKIAELEKELSELKS